MTMVLSSAALITEVFGAGAAATAGAGEEDALLAAEAGVEGVEDAWPGVAGAVAAGLLACSGG